jgi:hypothetical protein
MNFNPQDYVIFEGIMGSRLYGTNTENSDTDYRSICLPPLKVLINPFSKFEQKDSGFEEADKVIYDLGKYFELCSKQNPNLLETLFVPKNKIISKTSNWDLILENKHLFLSKKAKNTFLGYSFSQLHKIQLHRQWFIDPPKEKPTREMFGLTDSPIISGEGLLAVSNIKFDLLKESFQDEIRREIEYREEKKKWDNYISWKLSRNPERQRLEDKYKFDTKASSHLIRLMTEGKELLLTGNITFPLSNCEEIRAIKNGKYSYEEIIELSETMSQEFDIWYDQSILPDNVDVNKLTNLYFKIVLGE